MIASFYAACLTAGVVMIFGSIAVLDAQEKPKLDKQDLIAKDLAERFLKAVWKQDLDATMQLVDVPFFWDGVENIEGRDALKGKIAGLLKRDRSKIPFETKAVHTYGKLPQGFLNNKDGKLVDKILDKNDRIVHIEFKPPGRDGIGIMVRLRADQAKVVGFRD